MATLTVLSMTNLGSLKALVAATGGGDQFANPTDERTYLEVANGGGGSITVTITAQNTSFPGGPNVGTLTASNAGGAVVNGTTRVFGPFPARIYNDANGNVQVTYSGVTTVTVQALRIPAP